MEHQSKQRSPWRDVFRLAQGVQTVCFAAVLILVSLILVRVYAGAIATSRQTKDLNCAVQLCRSASEVFLSAQSPEEAAAVLGASMENGWAEVYYSGDLTPVSQEDAVYTVTLSSQQQERTSGTLSGCIVSAYRGDLLLYRLTPERFLGQEVAP